MSPIDACIERNLAFPPNPTLNPTESTKFDIDEDRYPGMVHIRTIPAQGSCSNIYLFWKLIARSARNCWK